MAVLPRTTRLRWRSAKKPEAIQAFCDTLGTRIEVKSVVFNPTDKKWYLWFIPGDQSPDLRSGSMKET